MLDCNKKQITSKSSRALHMVDCLLWGFIYSSGILEVKSFIVISFKFKTSRKYCISLTWMRLFSCTLSSECGQGMLVVTCHCQWMSQMQNTKAFKSQAFWLLSSFVDSTKTNFMQHFYFFYLGKKKSKSNDMPSISTRRAMGGKSKHYVKG